MDIHPEIAALAQKAIVEMRASLDDDLNTAQALAAAHVWRPDPSTLPGACVSRIPFCTL